MSLRKLKELKKIVDLDPEDLNYKPDWKSMDLRARAAYIWEYYKIPIIAALAVLYLIVSLILGYVNRTRTVLWVGGANIIADEEQTIPALTDGYTSQDPSFGKRDRVSFSQLGMFMLDPDSVPGGRSDVSLMKVLALTAAGQLDVFLMDRAALDYFSRGGYLMNLEELPEEMLDGIPAGRLVSAEVMLESNELERAYDPTLPVVEETEEQVTGISLDGCPLFGTGQEVYAGIVNQDSRIEESLKYVRYLLSL